MKVSRAVRKVPRFQLPRPPPSFALRGQQEVGGLFVIAAAQQAHRGDQYETPRDGDIPACGGRFRFSDDGVAHMVDVLLVHALRRKHRKEQPGFILSE